MSERPAPVRARLRKPGLRRKARGPRLLTNPMRLRYDWVSFVFLAAGGVALLATIPVVFGEQPLERGHLVGLVLGAVGLGLRAKSETAVVLAQLCAWAMILGLVADGFEWRGSELPTEYTRGPSGEWIASAPEDDGAGLYVNPDVWALGNVFAAGLWLLLWGWVLRVLGDKRTDALLTRRMRSLGADPRREHTAAQRRAG